MKKYALEVAFVIIGLCFVMLGYYCYLEYKKINSVTPLASSENKILEEGSGVAEYEIKTVIDIGSTSTFPFITKYSNDSAKNIVNESINGLSEGCFYPGDTKNTLIERALDKGPNFEVNTYEKKLQKLSVEQIKRILVEDQNMYYITDVRKSIYSKNDIYSFSFDYNYYCGGAYPDAGTSAVTYDLKTGKEIKLEDVFANYAQSPVINIFREYYNKEYLKENEGYEDYCSLSSEDSNGVFEYSTFYINDSSIVVIPSFNHASRACSLDVEVPIKKVIKYAKPNSILSRIAE